MHACSRADHIATIGDESGPPCTNCKVRGTDCSFPPPTSSSHSSSSPALDMPETSMSATSSAPSKRIAELRLMHYWSTVTCETMVSEIADDRDVWRTTIPEFAMKHDFLLNSIFSLTSFHLAYDKPQQAHQHISAALEYQTLAFSQMRHELSNFPDDVEAHEALLYGSLVLMVLALASSTQPTLKESMIQNTLVHFEFVRGFGVVMLKRPECMRENKLFHKLPDMMRLPKRGCSDQVVRAVEILTQMNEARVPANGEEEHSDDPAQAQGLPSSRLHLACKSAIWWLEYLFSTCSDRKLRGFALAWLSLAGEDFIQALKESDQVATLALMWWGVFVDPVGQKYWYGDSFGRDVANEVVEALGSSHDPAIGELILLAEQEFQAGASATESEDHAAGDYHWQLDSKPFWQVDDPDDPKSDHGNVPHSVLLYTGSQSRKQFSSTEELVAIAERIRNMR